MNIFFVVAASIKNDVLFGHIRWQKKKHQEYDDRLNIFNMKMFTSYCTVLNMN